MRTYLDDATWSKLKLILSHVGVYKTESLRDRVEGIIWRLRTGAPWRDLPLTVGSWKTVYSLWYRWSQNLVLQRVLDILKIIGSPDKEVAFLDSTSIKVHQHAAGAKKESATAIGSSRGGKTTKVHIITDAHGNIDYYEITEGNCHDAPMALPLIKKSGAENVVGDKAYDSQEIREESRSMGTTANIPSRKNSKQPNPDFDKDSYKDRHLVENRFCTMKQFRAFATRYDKLLTTFSSVVAFIADLQWIKLVTRLSIQDYLRSAIS